MTTSRLSKISDALATGFGHLLSPGRPTARAVVALAGKSAKDCPPGDDDDEDDGKGKTASNSSDGTGDDDSGDADAAGPDDEPGDDEPDKNKGKGKGAKADDKDKVYPDPDHDDKMAASDARFLASTDATVLAAREAERRRCAAIFAAPVAANNVPLACELAFESDMAASKCIAILAKAGPTAPAEGSRAALNARRAGASSNPDVSPNAGRSGKSPEQAAAEMWDGAYEGVNRMYATPARKS